MKLITTIEEMKNLAKALINEEKSIGLVPTMGFLHEGHQSLIKKSASQNDVTIVSVFVNPTQFAPNEDLDKYPRDLENDIIMAGQAGANVLFHPTPDDMYPKDYHTYINVESLGEGLCGKSRPTHFRGVTTVVAKLFNITKAHKAYFGQKDAQQLAIIKKMVEDLNMDIQIVPCPIIRESTGLAKSSRNTYLSQQEKEQALVLSKSLNLAQELFKSGEKDVSSIKSKIADIISSSPIAEIDYIDIVDFESVKKIDRIENTALVALAVRFGSTRLIDNTILEEN